MTTFSSKLRDNRGVALFIALMLVLMLSIIGIGLIKSSNDEISIAGNELQEMIAFYSAEAGLAQASAAVQTYYEENGLPPTDMPAGKGTMDNATMAYVTTSDGATVNKRLTAGPLAGLNASVKEYEIEAIGTSLVDASQIRLTQTFEAALVPIFQFAVFYDNDLWTTPAKAMTVTGRVHVSGNMYLQCSDELNFDGKITAAGGIHHGFPAWSGISAASGDVRFKDASGNYQDMYENGDWLDSDDSHWLDSASSRWTGNVRDEAFGVEDLSLPLTNASGDPHKIIERAAGNPDSYENKADLKIIDGQVYQKSGAVWSDVTAFVGGAISTTSFYDDRENKWVNSTDIDVAALNASGYFPTNGVLYASDQRSGYNATRLVNGSDLGDPLTLFSENPAYVKGSYNTVDKQPAAIVADAVSFLSNDWNDADSDKSLRTYRTVSSATQVNVSMITGDCTPTSSSYGGGLANLPRFLEHWGGQKFTYQGSMVNLWRSQQAIGKWLYGGYYEYYTAPTRDYRFDIDLEDPSKLPPATPQIQSFLRTGWKQLDVGFTAADMAGDSL